MICAQSSDRNTRTPEALVYMKIMPRNPAAETWCEPWLDMLIPGPLSAMLAWSHAVGRLGDWTALRFQILEALGLSTPW